MTDNQLVGSTSEDRESMHPDQDSSVGLEAAFIPAVPGHEDALVSGALRVSEESTSFQTASQDISESASEELAFKRTSLEILELAPSPLHLTLSRNDDAISTALPISNDEDLFESDANVNRHPRFQEASSQEPVGLAVKSYALITKTLSLHLPHLNNVKYSSRHDDVSVTCYDYSDNALASIEAFSVMQPSKLLQNAEGVSLRQYLESIPPEAVHLRLIVANDLSTDLIECLGTSFSISPEMYEEHLVNSGWQNGIYNDQQPEDWITRSMKKSHMSIRWYRPVKRVLQRPYSTTDRQRFLDPSTQPFRWTENIPDTRGKPHGVHHMSTPTTNIIRQDWDMKTNADASISAGGFAAWEERATVWNRQCDGYRVAVFLLDPLPIVKDEMTGAAEALRRLGVDHTEHAASPAERNITESSVPDRHSRALVRRTTHVRSRPKADQNFSFRTLGRFLFGTSSQPQDAPSDEPEALQHAQDPESGEQGRERQQRITGIARPRVSSGVPRLFDKLFGRSRKKTEETTGAEEEDVPEEKQGTEIKTLEPINRCMFEELYPRGPAVDYDFLMAPENVNMLAEYLNRTKPTAVSFAEWITKKGSQQPLMTGPTFHLECLFAIVQNDTVNTLKHMESALQEIGQHIIDDTLIQQRLVHWRLLLERFGNELQLLEDSLRRFADFINASESSRKDNEDSQFKHNPKVKKLLEEIVLQINSLRQRTTRSYKSLMANMSIVESKRGIMEAESVTKLTELAFFFIPLTFSASIFSMQVKELDASRISIAAFFTLAVLITTASYALRLLIRSEVFVYQRKRILTDIRQDAGLTPGSSIPTKTFLAWMWRRIGLLAVITTILVALLVTPVVVLWTKDINHGFKVLITILLLAFILAASYVTGNAMLYIDARGLHLRRDIFKPGNKVKRRGSQAPMSFSQTLAYLFSWLSSRWFWIGVVVTGVCAGTAAPLWTSQLTTAIKVGVTIAIALLYVGSVVAMFLYAIQNSYAIGFFDLGR